MTTAAKRAGSVMRMRRGHSSVPEAAPKRVRDTVPATVVRAACLAHPNREAGSGSRRLQRRQRLQHVMGENGDQVQVRRIQGAVARCGIKAASERVQVVRHDAWRVPAVQQLQELGVPIGVPRVAGNERQRRRLGVERICAADGVHEAREVGGVLLGRKLGLNAVLTRKLVAKLQRVDVAVARGKCVIQELLQVVALPIAAPRSSAARRTIGCRAVGSVRARWRLHTTVQRGYAEDDADIGQQREVQDFIPALQAQAAREIVVAEARGVGGGRKWNAGRSICRRHIVEHKVGQGSA